MTTPSLQLLGTYHPDIVGDLFRLQCGPWKNPILDCSEKTFESAYFTVESTLQHVNDEENLPGSSARDHCPPHGKTENELDFKDGGTHGSTPVEPSYNIQSSSHGKCPEHSGSKTASSFGEK